MNRYRNKWMSAISGLLITSLSGCALLSPVKTTTTPLSIIQANPADVKKMHQMRQTPLDITLFIRPFQADTPFLGTKMFYSLHHNQIQAYPQYEWASAPADMLYNTNVSYFNHSNQFRHIASGQFTGQYSYYLTATINQLIQTIQNKQESQVVLTMTYQIVDRTTGQLIASQRFSEKTTVDIGTKGFTQAANQLAGLIAQKAIDWSSKELRTYQSTH